MSLFATAPTAGVSNIIVVPEASAVLGGHGGAGGDGWGGREIEIARMGKEHLGVARFSRRDREDLETVGRIVGLVSGVVEAWDTHAGWGAGRVSGKPSHYLALRKDFTPVNGGGYGPVPIAGIMQDTTRNTDSSEGLVEEGCKWVEEDEGYRRWHEHWTKNRADKKERKDIEETDIVSVSTLDTETKGGAVLHIHGKAGTGKTVLARYLVQQLLREASATLTAPPVPTLLASAVGVPAGGGPSEVSRGQSYFHSIQHNKQARPGQKIFNQCCPACHISHRRPNYHHRGSCCRHNHPPYYPRLHTPTHPQSPLPDLSHRHYHPPRRPHHCYSHLTIPYPGHHLFVHPPPSPPCHLEAPERRAMVGWLE